MNKGTLTSRTNAINPNFSNPPKRGKLPDGDTIVNTVKARGSVYGDFSDNAVVAQEIKEALRRAANWSNLRPVHREALDVMASKMSRIVTGDPEYKDNWHDIQGYAKITEDRCK